MVIAHIKPHENQFSCLLLTHTCRQDCLADDSSPPLHNQDADRRCLSNKDWRLNLSIQCVLWFEPIAIAVDELVQIWKPTIASLQINMYSLLFSLYARGTKVLV